MSDNLPCWPGAAKVYERVSKINALKCAEAYAAASTPKAKRRGAKYRVPEEVESAIGAMNSGDEEFLKGYVARNLSAAIA